jgi:hypothetical protein
MGAQDRNIRLVRTTVNTLFIMSPPSTLCISENNYLSSFEYIKEWGYSK